MDGRPRRRRRWRRLWQTLRAILAVVIIFKAPKAPESAPPTGAATAAARADASSPAGAAIRLPSARNTSIAAALEVTPRRSSRILNFSRTRSTRMRAAPSLRPICSPTLREGMSSLKKRSTTASRSRLPSAAIISSKLTPARSQSKKQRPAQFSTSFIRNAASSRTLRRQRERMACQSTHSGLFDRSHALRSRDGVPKPRLFLAAATNTSWVMSCAKWASRLVCRKAAEKTMSMFERTNSGKRGFRCVFRRIVEGIQHRSAWVSRGIPVPFGKSHKEMFLRPDDNGAPRRQLVAQRWGSKTHRLSNSALDGLRAELIVAGNDASFPHRTGRSQQCHLVRFRLPCARYSW